ncbi:hypothetical protein Tco_1539039 [Tanacetum coccineum]
MAGDQQQQQNMLDALLVPIDEQVKIGLSNFRIALDKSQPDVIYKGRLQLMIDQDFLCLKFYGGMVTGENADFAELICEDFRFQIDSRKSSKQKQEL